MSEPSRPSRPTLSRAHKAASKAPSGNAKTAKVSAALEATRLLGKWMRLAQGHALFAAGCACGAGFGSVQLQDFEQQILDYLHGKHSAAGHQEAVDLLRAGAGYRHGEAGSVAALLRAMATQREPRGEAGRGEVQRMDEQLALLADLEVSLDSFGELHRGV